MSNPDYYAIGSVTFYFGVDIVLALLLGTRIFRNDRDRILPFSRMCALTLVSDIIAILVPAVLFLCDSYNYNTLPICHAITGFVFYMVVLSGFSLARGSYPSLRHCVGYAIPYVAVFVASLCNFAIPSRIGPLVILISTVIFMVFLAVNLVIHDRKLKDRYSNLENHSTRWYVYFLILEMFELALWYLMIVRDGSSWVMTTIYDFLVPLTWMLLAHFCMRQRYTSVLPDSDYADSKDDVKSDLPDRLRDLMDSEKLYRNSELDLDTLAAALQTNSTYLYRCLHDDLGTTFYDYVNGLRVDDAKLILVDSDDKMDVVAEKCGFNSSRAFHRVFKQIVGTTPGEWRKNQ